MSEIFVTAVTADEMSAVEADCKLGFKNKHFLTLSENLFAKKQMCLKAFRLKFRRVFLETNSFHLKTSFSVFCRGNVHLLLKISVH